MAVDFDMFNQLPKDNEELANSMRGMMKELRVRLQETFSITGTQQVCTAVDSLLNTDLISLNRDLFA